MVSYQVPGGLVLRLGETDTPAPEGSFKGPAPPRIVVAIAGTDLRVRADLQVNVVGREPQTVALRPVRRTKNEQFFEASFPRMRPGEEATYSVTVRSGRGNTQRRFDSKEEGGTRRLRFLETSSSDPGEAVAGTAGSSLSRRKRRSTRGNTTGSRRTLHGSVIDGLGRIVEGASVRIYKVDFGGESELVGETIADNKGRFSTDIPAGMIEVREVKPDGSEVQIKAPGSVTDSSPMTLVSTNGTPSDQAEFNRLRDAVSNELGNFELLGEAQENGQRADLGLLAETTGFDARLLAFGAEAVKRSRDTGLSTEVLYAMFRGGLPRDLAGLASVTPEAMNQAVTLAKASGVVSTPVEVLTQAESTLRNHRTNVLLDTPAKGVRHSVGDYLDQAGLDATQKAAFVELAQATNGHTIPWEQLEQEGYPTAALKLQGKLFALMGGSPEVLLELEQELNDQDVSSVVDVGMHKAEDVKAWLMRTAARLGKPVDDLVSSSCDAPTAEERLDQYAETVAKKTVESFPTQVVAKLVADGEIGDSLTDTERRELEKILRKAGGDGFKIGQTPVDEYFSRNKSKFTEDIDEATLLFRVRSIRELTRVYQFAPAGNVELLKGTLNGNPIDVTDGGFAEFKRRYGHLFGRPEEALFAYRRAEKARTASTEVAMQFNQLANGLPVFALSGNAKEREDALSSVIEKLPALEELLGSLDFCECEHCRSILSPAAYLVDLLEFLRDSVSTEESVNDTALDALLARRPDIENIPLTCENTNTELPYIDVVCEIMEHLIVHGSGLGEFAPDIGNLESEDALAEPQSVLAAAHELLGGHGPRVWFSSKLPFSLWLEMIRALLANREVSLAELRRATVPESAPLFPDETDGLTWWDVFLEELVLSRPQADLLAPPDPIERWYERFAYASENQALDGEQDSDEPLSSALDDSGDGGSWQVLPIYAANNLARRLQVSYVELASILRTRFVNPGLHNAEVGPAVVLFWPDTGCSFDQVSVNVAGTDEFLKDPLTYVKTSVFVRFWRHIGWSISDVDRALSTLVPSGALDPTLGVDGFQGAVRTAIIYCAHITRLQELLNLKSDTVGDLCALWTLLDTHGSDSPYALRFLQRNVVEEASPFEAVRDGSSVDLFAHLPALQGALGLVESDIRHIVAHRLELSDAVSIPSDDDGQPILDLTAATVLHRYAFLADALDVSVRDVLRLERLSGIDPFPSLPELHLENLSDDRAYQQTLAFVELAQTILSSQFSFEELEYIAQHTFDPVGTFKEPEDVLDVLLDGLESDFSATNGDAEWSAALELVVARLGGDPDVTRTFVESPDLQRSTEQRTPLETLLRAGELVVDARAYASPDCSGEPIERRALSSFGLPLPHPEANSICLEMKFTSPHAGLREIGFAGDLLSDSNAEALPFEVQLSDAPVDLTLDESCALATLDLVSGRNNRLRVSVKNWSGEGLSGFVDATDLPGRDPSVASGTDAPCFELSEPLTYLAQYGVPVRESIDETRIRVAKAIRIAQALTLTPSEIVYLFGTASPFAGLDFDDIPAEARSLAGAQSVFGGIVRLLRYEALREHMVGGEPELQHLLAAAHVAHDPSETHTSTVEGAIDHWTDLVAKLARRDSGAVTEVLSVLNISAVSRPEPPEEPTYHVLGELYREDQLARAWQLLELAHRLGAPPLRLSTFASPEPDAGVASELREIIRSGYGAETWNRAVRPIWNDLRIKRRDALVAYILHKHEFDSVEQLYEYLLVDPATAPVVTTSRIQLAIASTQLFVQRCLLGLERRNVLPASIDKTEWLWKKRYRVWEANRKIYIFPENWLEPEFRDDKSHLFAALEGELLQEDVTQESAELAYLNYLRGLQTIARLDIIATYAEQRQDPGENTLHVVGRTTSVPYQYFYRKLQFGAWTPWQPMEIEAESQNFALTVWREQVYLFWVRFLEKPQPQESFDPPKSDEKFGNVEVGDLLGTVGKQKPMIEVDVNLHWTRAVNGAWDPPRTTDGKDPIIIDAGTKFHASRVHFYLRHETDPLDITDSLGGHPQGLFLVVEYDRQARSKGTAQVFYFPSPIGQPSSENRGWLDIGYAPYDVTPHSGKLEAKGARLKLHDEFKDLVTDGGENVLDGIRSLDVTFPSNGVLAATNETELQIARMKQLVFPFFFSDAQHTFFVEPTFESTTVDTYEGYIVLQTVPPEPKNEAPYAPGDFLFFDPRLHDAILKGIFDDPNVLGPLIQFGDALVGPGGGFRGGIGIGVPRIQPQDALGPETIQPIEDLVSKSPPQTLETSVLLDKGGLGSETLVFSKEEFEDQLQNVGGIQDLIME